MQPRMCLNQNRTDRAPTSNTAERLRTHSKTAKHAECPVVPPTCKRPRRVGSMVVLLAAFLACCGFANGASVTLAWDPSPDGSVTGYIVHQGSSSGAYTRSTRVGNVTEAVVADLVVGATYFFVVTAHNSAGLESIPSNEVRYTVPVPDAQGSTGYVTAVSPGTLRNDYSGFVGMSFTVGDQALEVSALGRMKVAGNGGAHLLRLIRAADGGDVPGGAVLVSMASGAAGQFQYAPLASPITLSPNTRYYLVSQESVAGDTWYNFDTVLGTTSVAIQTSAVWGSGTGQWNLAGRPGQSYVPVDFRYSQTTPPAGNPPQESAFVSSSATGTLRNGFTGFLGMAVSVGAEPITITSLGRMKHSGNSRSHTLKLVRASDGQDVPGGSAVVHMSGGTVGEFLYAPLVNPVTLPAQSLHYLVSEETIGGDLWSESTTTVKTTATASVPYAVWGFGPGQYYPWGAAGNTYVPVNFRYLTDPSSGSGRLPPEFALVTNAVPGTLRDGFTGFLGMAVSVGSEPITVTSLGRMKLMGNSATHTVKLVRSSDGQDVPGASAVVDMNGGSVGEFRYARLTTPVTLPAGSLYYVVSEETVGGDFWAESNTIVSTTPAAAVPYAVWGFGPGQYYPWGAANRAFVPVNLTYSTAAGNTGR